MRSDRVKWGSPCERETWLRIMLSVWAYAYEIAGNAMVSDDTFDLYAYKVNLSVHTKRPDMDKWFKENFTPISGMWIHNHPELEKVAELYKWIMDRKKGNRMAKIGCVITPSNANWEYRCGKCGQLRFYPGANRPINCGNCRSIDIEIGRPGTLPIPQDVVGAPLYAAGFKNPDGMGMFGGPTTNLQSLLDMTPPAYNPQNGRAYIVQLDQDDVKPIARWNDGKWQRKGNK